PDAMLREPIPAINPLGTTHDNLSQPRDFPANSLLRNDAGMRSLPRLLSIRPARPAGECLGWSGPSWTIADCRGVGESGLTWGVSNRQKVCWSNRDFFPNISDFYNIVFSKLL